MRKLKSIILLLGMQMVVLTAYAQTITSISGNVSDDTEPLIGATICEMDANGRIIESAVTDLDGNFTMKIQNPKNRLRFSYVGMKEQFHPINKTTYNIIMKLATSLQEGTVVSKNVPRATRCPSLSASFPTPLRASR